MMKKLLGLAIALSLFASPAGAGLKIRPVFIGGLAPTPPVMVGGGDLEEIFKVAAEAWEAVFNTGGGEWQVTIEFGWRVGLGQNNARQFFVEEGGNNPVRMTKSRVEFNSVPLAGHFFADPTPRDS